MSRSPASAATAGRETSDGACRRLNQQGVFISSPEHLSHVKPVIVHFGQRQTIRQGPFRLLVCVPNVPRRPDNTNRLYSLGLLYLKRAAIEAGWNCDLLDAYFSGLGRQETVDRIIAGPQPDLIGFSLHTPRMHDEAAWIMETLKHTAGWNIPVVAGGHYASMFGANILTGKDRMDFVIEGEGEDPLHDLLAALAAGRPLDSIAGLKWRGPSGRVEGDTPRCRVADLDRPGNISFDWVEEDIQPDEWSLVTSRGCPGDCGFCLVGRLWGRLGDWRGHSPEWVVGRVEELVRLKGASSITMVDDNFLGDNDPERRARAIASLMKSRGLFVPFSIMARADTVVRHPEAFRELRGVGLESVFLGLESGDDRLLQRLGKRSDAATGKAAVRTLDRLGLKVTIGVIIFHPWMTKEGILSDLQYLEGIMLDCPGASLIGLNELDVFGGTPVARRLDPEGRQWRLPWKAADRAGQGAYESWQIILSAVLFPAMRAAAKHDGHLRRSFALWQIQALRELVATGEQRPLEENLIRLRASICSLLLKHTGRAVVEDFLGQNPAESVKGCAAERCFTRVDVKP